MRRAFTILFATLVVALALTGCGKKADQAATPASGSDSLLSSNPVEQPQGQITPQQPYQKPEQNPPSTPTPANKPMRKPKPRPASGRTAAQNPAPSNPGVTVPAGTPIKVTVDSQISSETANEGDTFTATVREAVVIGTAAPIPVGSKVQGVIIGAAPAKKGGRAMLVLQLRSVEVDGKSYAITAGTDSLVAGSTRTRNVGAIAGGAAAGALIGRAIGGSGKGALIGGLLGGAAATGAVASTKGYQMVVKEGAEMTFTVNQSVVMK